MNWRWLNSAASVAAVTLCSGIASGQALAPKGAGLEPGVLPQHWITGGPDCSVVPKRQMHPYNADLYILRESGCTEEAGTIDLGGRVLDVIAIPGHQPFGVAFYDRRTRVLLTGDTLYPGRLYVADFPAFAASIQRVVDFTRGKLVAHILGCHIEESSTPFLDYPVGTKYARTLACAPGGVKRSREGHGRPPGALCPSRRHYLA